MITPETLAPRRHVLLVGIDAYERVEPLFGCVNDIDAIEAILLDRLGVPAEAITKFVAPHPWQTRSPRLPEGEPTSANLRAALEALAGDSVRPGDRVLIYYAGHGTQVLTRSSRVPREALVPVDVHSGGDLLYDYTINDVLQRIAARTADLTLVLDCCCSAGATRSGLTPPGSAVRFCRVDGSLLPPPARSQPRSAGAPPAGLLTSTDPSDPGFVVATACQANERAHEGPSSDGQRRGAFTEALLDLLAAEPDERLASRRWGDLWLALREHVSSRYPGQHPWLIGRPERRLFGGAWSRQDLGYPIARDGDKYRIHAGTMVGLAAGAQVAVYGPSPDTFPPLGSQEDLAARLGVLVVEAATPSSCTAAPSSGTFGRPEGARGRLIAPGRPDALVVALDPYDAELARWIESEGPFRIERLHPSGSSPTIAEAFVTTTADGRRWIGDAIYGAGAPERDGEPPLAWVDVNDREALLRCLSHYAKYNLALRLSSRCRDLPGALHVRVLDCRDLTELSAADLQDPPLPELPPDPEHRYRYLVEHGQPACVVIENRSSTRLYANLINCAASGRVEILGATQLEIPPARRQTFWLRGLLGKAFPCTLPKNRSSGVERLIAVGTTVPDVDLSFLQQSASFEEAICARTRSMLLKEDEPLGLATATLMTMKLARVLSGSA